MKKLLIFVVIVGSIFCSSTIFAQNYPITNITISLPTNPPANTADWATVVPPVMITARGAMQNGQLNGQVVESKMFVTIKRNGSKICGMYSRTSAPSAGFNSTVKNWSGAQVISMLGQDCSLQPGSYELCVQFFTMNTPVKELSQEVCKPFTIADVKEQQYSPPTNIAPTNNKQFKENEAKAITLRWTPIVPKPQQPVTYRLRVWQLMQGQNGTQAMRSNQPIVTKDVDNITQAIVTEIYTGPCRPPYLCDYVWNVEASKTNPLGQIEMLGKSEPTTFNIASSETPQTAIINNVYPTDKAIFSKKEMSGAMTFRWTPLIPKPRDPVTYRLKVWQLMQGQNGTTAMRTNKPIVTKDVIDIAETKLEAGIFCKPPTQPCPENLVWIVEVLDKQGEIVASSQPTSFTSSSCTPGYDMTTKKAECNQQDGKVHVSGNINLTLPSGVTVSSVKITQLTENSYSGPAVSTSLILPKLLTLTGGNYPFNFIVNNAMCNKKLFIGYQIISVCASTGISNTIDCVDSIVMPCCKCNTCDQISFELGQETSTFNPGPKPWLLGDNNHLYLTQPLIVGPASIKVIQVKTEVVDFYWYTEKADCRKCENNSYYWGNLIKGTTNAPGFNTSGTAGVDDTGIPLPNSHEMQFISTTPAGATFNGNILLTLSLPPQTELSCCTDCFRFCIRYTIVFMENGVCKTCTKVKCYEIKRTHRPSMMQPWPPLNACGDQNIIIDHNGGVLQAKQKSN